MGLTRREFLDMSWPEFYYATEGYFDEMRQQLGIPKERDMSAPSDEMRKRIKQRTEPLWQRKIGKA